MFHLNNKIKIVITNKILLPLNFNLANAYPTKADEITDTIVIADTKIVFQTVTPKSSNFQAI